MLKESWASYRPIWDPKSGDAIQFSRVLGHPNKAHCRNSKAMKPISISQARVASG